MQPIEPDLEPLFWVESDCPQEPWTIAYGFVGHSGTLALAEARIFPTSATDRAEGRRVLGTWTRNPALVPVAGLPARIARAPKPGRALTVALGSVLLSDSPAGNAGHFAVRANRAPAKSSKPQRDSRLLARVAILYEAGMSDASKRPAPNKHVWQELQNTEHQLAKRSVEALVREARRAGYLTPATKGRAGGRATQLAHDMCPTLRSIDVDSQ
jgi:hypothetical protein